MRKERDHAAATALLKQPSIKFSEGSAEESYMKILNPYPFQQLLKQITLSADPKITACDELYNFTYECQGNAYPVNAVSCNCVWHKSMRLPCRHILSVRRKMSISLFDSTLCDRRWLKSHLMSAHKVFNEDKDFSATYSESDKSRKVPKTTNERYNHLLALVQKIAAVGAESTENDFLDKENSLKHLLQ